VPLIVRGPAIAKGRVETAIALNIDLAPTFAAIAQARAPESVDGRSLYRLLVGKATMRDWRKDFLVELRSKEDAGITEFAALRTTDKLYVEYVNGDRELYDLIKDPHQLESVAQAAEPELLEKLAARLAVLRACKGDGCRS
jgi:arylsulfatase A-like enzyme